MERKKMDVMKPISSSEIPLGNEWLYEVKYDGYRCILRWSKDNLQLLSKNKTDLTDKFPEIIEYCKSQQAQLQQHLPLTIDGELVVLNNSYQANFSWIQKRARMHHMDSIQAAAMKRPASFMAFDLILFQGKPMTNQTLEQRKTLLQQVFAQINTDKLCYVTHSFNAEELWNTVYTYLGEGIVAKRKKSTYKQGRSHQDWFKIKNWREISGVLTTFDESNHYFHVAVFKNDETIGIGKCKHGLNQETFQALQQLFKTEGKKQHNLYHLPPAICASIYSLDLYEQELREPEFKELLPDALVKDMTWEQLQLSLAMLPESVELANTDKLFWPAPNYTKGDLIVYIREIAPYILPFLQERALTIIRAPEGVEGETFFQKHLPDYAPAFIPRRSVQEGKSLILCENIEALVWYANHGTIEFHTPFQTMNTSTPEEIVFDLDPPNRDSFYLAIKAANLLKHLLDELSLKSFVKTSGNKGLQVYIPIPSGSMSYEQTAVFTKAIAWTMESAYPNLFTTERMKRKRGDRLYIDFVQHGKGKTIIAPYSPRKTPEGTVATPLFWHEVTDELSPLNFTIKNVLELINKRSCPMQFYQDVKEKQQLDPVLTFLQNRTN
jgi:bifunctional non-homologous end joining protein LigD